MRTLIVGDVHVPFHDTAALERFIKRERPQRVVLLGDVMDFHAITEHPRQRKWLDRLDFEVRAGRRWLQKLRLLAGPRCDIVYIKGNHEHRWDRTVDKNLPAMRNLNHMALPEVLGLPDLGIDYHDVGARRKGVRVPCGQGQVLYCYHGHELKGKYKGSTALGYAVAWGKNAMIGHTHRVSLDHASSGGRRLFAIEGGYLGKPTAPAFTYAGPAPSTWVRGFWVADAEQTRSPYPTFHSADV